MTQHFPLDMSAYPIDMWVKPEVTGFFDPETNTIFICTDPKSPSCAIIDTVMDIDYAAGRMSFASADRVIAFVKDHELKVEWLIETHAHADHLSAAPYLQQKLGGKLRETLNKSGIHESSEAVHADCSFEGDGVDRWGR